MIYAMFMMSMLTILIGLIAVKSRLLSVKNGQLSPSYFSLMQGDKVPDVVIKTSRCFNNMFEMPTLFYIVCTLYIVLGIESYAAVIVAWLFFLFRCAQAFIHLSSNNVRLRMLTFGASVLSVFFLWVNLMIAQY